MRVGIDQLPVSAVEDAMGAHADRYLRRVYTAGELRDCAGPDGRPDAERLAARFAAKEAAIKVLRPRDEPVPWSGIEVVKRPGGWVELELSGAAAALAERQELTDFAVSLTHEAGRAAAVVIAQDHRQGSPT